MTVKGPHEGGMQGGLEGQELGHLSVCTHKTRGLEVSMSGLPPDWSLAFCLTKADESTTSHLLSSGWSVGEKFLSLQIRVERANPLFCMLVFSKKFTFVVSFYSTFIYTTLDKRKGPE